MALSTDSQCENHVPGPFRALHSACPLPGARKRHPRAARTTDSEAGRTYMDIYGEKPVPGEAKACPSPSFLWLLWSRKAAPASSQGRRTPTNHADSSGPEAAFTQRTFSLCTGELSSPERKRLFSELLRRQRNRELGVLLTLSGLGISESGTARPVRCWGVEGVHLPV